MIVVFVVLALLVIGIAIVIVESRPGLGRSHPGSRACAGGCGVGLPPPRPLVSRSLRVEQADGSPCPPGGGPPARPGRRAQHPEATVEELCRRFPAGALVRLGADVPAKVGAPWPWTLGPSDADAYRLRT